MKPNFRHKHMKTIISFFSGKKAYIVGILMVVLGILQGNQDMILQGLSVITIRAGIAKISTQAVTAPTV